MEAAAAQDWFLRKHEDGEYLWSAPIRAACPLGFCRAGRAVQEVEERYRALELKYRKLAQPTDL